MSTVWGQSRQVVTYYDQARRLVKERYVVSGKPPQRNGSYEGFYANGRPRAKGTYRNGTPEGNWRHFYENGRTKMAGPMQAGLKNGVWTYFYENGNPQMSGTFAADVRNGQWQYHYENGAVKSEGMFAEDLKNGRWRYFYEDGRVKAEGVFANDNGWYREFYASGAVRMEGRMRNGRSDSLWRYYYENSKLKAVGPEHGGTREGTWQFYDSDGILTQEGDYRNNIPKGRWRYFHPNGKTAAEGEKKDGREEGMWNLFYPTGSVRGQLDYSQPDKNYQAFYENGKLKARGTVRNEKHEGAWEYFYEDDGAPEGRCVFVNGRGLYKGVYKDGSPRMEGYLENDRRVGRWTLYKPDGTVAGYYEAFYDTELPQPVAIPDTATVTDTLLPASNLPYNKPSLRLPRQRNWHFVSRPNEYRASILGINPLAMLWQGNPSLPVSLEYYMHERLGYELTATLFRDPFFAEGRDVSPGNVFGRGLSLGLKQKFYQPDGRWGMFYVAHEVRFTGIMHRANLFAGQSLFSVSANETRYEYSVMLGDRILSDPSRQRQRLTLDGFAGLGVAYRHFDPQWQNRPDWDAVFDDVPKRPFLLTLRLGIMLGYAF